MCFRLFAITVVLLGLSTGLAEADPAVGPKSLGVFGSWQAFASKDGGQNVCYMALSTHGATAKKSKRGPIILMITQRPGENAQDVVSYAAGYNFKAATDLRITLGKSVFTLFTQKDTAWSRDAMTDHALTLALRKSASLTATGSPATKGAGQITDTLPLKGTEDAYEATAKACGIDVEPLPKAAPTSQPLHKKSGK